MRRQHAQLADGRFSATVLAYGHYGRPVLVFPDEEGTADAFENHGMVAAVIDLIEAGRVKFYCIDSADRHTWSDHGLPAEERARRHEDYQSWVIEQVLPWISADSGGASEFMTLGCSMGAFHAANFSLKRADLFPVAVCLSGNYDPRTWNSWGEQGQASYFNNPMAYVENLAGDHLDWLRSRVSLLLVVGQGAWEVRPTGALPSTREFAARLSAKGIRHELDLWGFDVAHDWPSWRSQLAHHLPRFC
jgi:esterase/lipase superfamily enzyme